ncbi:Thiamine-monophosphate kinase [hydrothermal vent metagenome]|uniref:Thiamine-monophosphate kinase n=1 Tax=hydrothermal vent metagenome TaxID=652676 RepID=A0A3B1C330_9ZZZZ
MGHIEELGLIRQIEKTFRQKDPNLLLGIGDDCASIKVSPGYELLVTTDTLVENVHFRKKLTTPKALGWKSAAVNLSDIAAMGGSPKFLFLSLSVTKEIDKRWMSSFLKGFKEALDPFGCVLAGGNFSSAKREISITATALGEVKQGLKALRSGAKPGDYIFVTGTPGDSALGLDLLSSAKENYKKHERKLIARHQTPTPRVEWGKIIAKNRLASAMIDISDGVALDLYRILEASGVSGEIDLAKFPLSKETLKVSEEKGKIPWRRILTGGEDYELLFTVSPKKLEAVKRLVAGEKLDAVCIGALTKCGSRAVPSLKVLNVSGKELKLGAFGWTHKA